MRLPTLWGRDKDDPFAALQQEVEKVFDNFTRSWPAANGFARGGLLAPRVDIHETDAGLEVSAELPGVDENNVDVTLADNLLTIKGEKKSEREETGEGRFISERSYGAFQRSLTLPYAVDADKIDASFDKGVLRISLPKSPDLKDNVRKIAIRGAN